MRTALTLGFFSDGTAEIITGPEVALSTQQRAFKELTAGKSKYAEVQYWESSGGIQMRKSFGDKGTVNFNSAHLVENQSAKGKLKKGQTDLTPTSGGKGGVNFNAAHPVEKQQDKKTAKHLPDLNKAIDAGETGGKSGVNFDCVTPVEEQGKIGKKKAASRKKSSKKSAKTSADKSTPPAPPPASDSGKAADSKGPTL